MNYARLEKQLRRHEGYRKRPYKDTEGVLTIGYGRNLDDVGISRAEARIMLKNDISVAETECEKHMDFFTKLNSIRQEVLVNMMLNMGWDRLRTFKKMLKALRRAVAAETPDYLEVKAQMIDSKWAKQVKGRADELAKMMETGKEAINGQENS